LLLFKEKQLIHKLFKVLVPRYINYSESFTAMHLIPINVKATLEPGGGRTGHYQKAVLELKGIIYLHSIIELI